MNPSTKVFTHTYVSFPVYSFGLKKWRHREARAASYHQQNHNMEYLWLARKQPKLLLLTIAEQIFYLKKKNISWLIILKIPTSTNCTATLGLKQEKYNEVTFPLSQWLYREYSCIPLVALCNCISLLNYLTVPVRVRLKSVRDKTRRRTRGMLHTGKLNMTRSFIHHEGEKIP